MAKTRIDWCDETWNPVWGCLRNCSYCYARKIAARFGKTDLARAFVPVRVNSEVPKFAASTRRVFVGSMSDPEYWSPEDWDFIISVVKMYPSIDFVFLTKGEMSVYSYLIDAPLPVTNVILGITRCSVDDLLTKSYPDVINRYYHRWLLNIEPIKEPIVGIEAVSRATLHFDWIILGAETGNRKDKPVPTWFWFNSIVDVSRHFSFGSPVFMKESLRSVVPPEKFIQQYPKELQ